MKKIIFVLLTIVILTVSIFTLVFYIEAKSTNIILQYTNYKLLKQYESPSDDIHSADNIFNIAYEESEYLAKNEKDFIIVELELDAFLSSSNVDCNFIEVLLTEDFKNKTPFVYCRKGLEKDLKVPELNHKRQSVNLELIVHKSYLKNNDANVFLKNLEFSINYYVKKSFVTINKTQLIKFT